MKRTIKIYGKLLPFLYIGIFIALAAFLYRYMENTANINPIYCMTPLITYIGIAFAFITIQNNKQNNREKNALEFEGVMSSDEMRKAIGILETLRKEMLNNKGELNRKAMSDYMNKLSLVEKSDREKIIPEIEILEKEKEIKELKKSNNTNRNKRRISKLKETIKNNENLVRMFEVRSAMSCSLNAMEACANAIRYKIYDEDLIYNMYGSQLMKMYEMCFSYIKNRQVTDERFYMNFEWLSVKWTIQRKISGELSKRMKKTSDAIDHANKALNDNRKASNAKKLKKHLAKLEKLRLPD